LKLQKQRTREVKGKEYHRWAVVLPPIELEKLRWKEGEELEAEARGNELIVKKKPKAK
jgi:antitoxin component of MazEF toxin-antitoxin module